MFTRLKSIHSVRGQNGFFNLVLTERNVHVEFDLMLSVHSLGLDIWILTFKFDFGLIGWPSEPPRERASKINKITTKHSRVIQIVEFSFILTFWKPFFLVESWNIIFQFLHLFCWRLLRPDYVTFVKIGSNNQNVHNSGFQSYLQI